MALLKTLAHESTMTAKHYHFKLIQKHFSVTGRNVSSRLWFPGGAHGKERVY